MFVFKAAVVGAGVMGGEIAQVVAAADIPVVLKDVEQRFVDTGLAKAREVTEGQVGKLVAKGRLDADAGAAETELTMRSAPSGMRAIRSRAEVTSVAVVFQRASSMSRACWLIGSATPNALAIASAVMSSWVGPLPPGVKT